jgi:hypothetical protein
MKVPINLLSTKINHDLRAGFDKEILPSPKLLSPRLNAWLSRNKGYDGEAMSDEEEKLEDEEDTSENNSECAELSDEQRETALKQIESDLDNVEGPGDLRNQFRKIQATLQLWKQQGLKQKAKDFTITFEGSQERG